MYPLLSNVTSIYLRNRTRFQFIDSFGPLLLRVTVGVVFAASGWGKLGDLDKVAEFFSELGIAAPRFNALLVACTECFGGIALVLGLMTRLAAVPLAITMLVAIGTALLPDVSSLIDLFGLNEFIYLVVLTNLALTGPGRWSLDHWLGERVFTLAGQRARAASTLTASP